MNNMETYYLVDFENVHNEGVEHISSLSKDDHIHIFYTKNALNISLEIYSKTEEFIKYLDDEIKSNEVKVGIGLPS